MATTLGAARPEKLGSSPRGSRDLSTALRPAVDRIQPSDQWSVSPPINVQIIKLTSFQSASQAEDGWSRMLTPPYFYMAWHSDFLEEVHLILLMWRIWWAPNNASKWQMGFNSAFKGLIYRIFRRSANELPTALLNKPRRTILLQVCRLEAR
jgi:hypothetical protein